MSAPIARPALDTRTLGPAPAFAAPTVQQHLDARFPDKRAREPLVEGNLVPVHDQEDAGAGAALRTMVRSVTGA
jgi:hypothetical protein